MSTQTIPLIDFSPFLHGTPAQKLSTASAILSGFQRSGFIYLSNFGIPASDIRETFAASARFFARSPEEKETLAWTTPRANRGYSGPGREKTTDLKDAGEIAKVREAEGQDLKESMEIGRDDVAGEPNQWPASTKPGDQADEFRRVMMAFHERGRVLHGQIMRAIAVGLGIDEDWFEGFVRKGDNTLRLLHYPEVEASVFRENERAVRAGAHTDYGSITCLFQDDAGGLQVLSPDDNKTYIDATPIPDTIVVNAGDLLARWSNDTIRSTKHRVVEPRTAAKTHPPRYSIAYFCNPDFDRFIEAIPGTIPEGGVRKYAGVNSGDYLEQRLSATY